MQFFHYDGVSLLPGILFALFLLALSFFFATYARAVDTITIDLGGTPLVMPVNVANKSVIARLLVKENARRAAQTPPLVALTLEQFTRDLFVDMVRGYKVQTAGEEHVDACTVFKALTAAQQATIITSMGSNNPCP